MVDARTRVIWLAACSNRAEAAWKAFTPDAKTVFMTVTVTVPA